MKCKEWDKAAGLDGFGSFAVQRVKSIIVSFTQSTSLVSNTCAAGYHVMGTGGTSGKERMSFPGKEGDGDRKEKNMCREGRNG